MLSINKGYFGGVKPYFIPVAKTRFKTCPRRTVCKDIVINSCLKHKRTLSRSGEDRSGIETLHFGVLGFLWLHTLKQVREKAILLMFFFFLTTRFEPYQNPWILRNMLRQCRSQLKFTATAKHQR